MTKLFTFLLTLCSLSLSAQTIGVSDFEDFNLEIDTFLNGSEGEGSYNGNGIILPIDFNAEFQSWTGWAISTMTDTSTPGFANQYSAIPGHGADSSQTYAVSFHFIPNELYIPITIGGGDSYRVRGFNVTNGTYPYLSMRDGDMFAKKFGGVSGDDPDYLLLTIKGYEIPESDLIDSIDFYLADFRFDDNSLDYIVGDWNYVDLSSIADAKYLTFTMASSDVGMFGINTPTYFCMDNFEVDVMSNANDELSNVDYNLFPNPASDQITVDYQGGQGIATIYNSNGEVVLSKQVEDKSSIQIDYLPSGIYTLTVTSKKGMGTKQFVVR